MENELYIGSFSSLLKTRPTAVALISGNENFPEIQGRVLFFQLYRGVVVFSEIVGLPKGSKPCGYPVFAFHIHEGTSCSGTENDSFADTLGHYNPEKCPHPYHAGDMPPLFGVDGKAFSAFLTNRFTVNEVIGKAVIIHSSADDFTTQPSGNAGQKIACGTIKFFGT